MDNKEKDNKPQQDEQESLPITEGKLTDLNTGKVYSDLEAFILD